MRHKLLCFLLCWGLMLFMVWPAGTVQAAGEFDFSSPSYEDPNILIGRDMSIPVYKAGESVSLSVPIENSGKGRAKNFVVSLQVGDMTNFPFEIDKMSMTRSIPNISGNSQQNVNFYLKVPLNAQPKVYPIGVNVDYTTEGGGGGHQSGTIYVKIVSDNELCNLRVVGTEISGDKLVAGQTEVVKLQIKNFGDLEARDVEVHLSGFTPDGLSLDRWVDTQNIRSIAGRETKAVDFQIHTDKEMKSGTYALDTTFKYKDEYEHSYSGEGKVFIPVKGKDDSSDDTIPRLIIDSFSFGGDYAQAGEVFTLNISFLNTNETNEVKNIKLTFNSDEQTFSPVGSGNSLYIAKIAPQERVEKAINLRPRVDAKQQTHNITIDLSYQDQKGEKYEEKEIIGIPVIQEQKLVVAEIETPPQTYMDSPVGITVDFYNKGRAPLRNLMISSEGDFEIQNSEVYIGNLEAGKDDYYDVTIIPHKQGNLAGKVLFEYEDEMGKHYSVSRAFNLNVSEQPPMPGPEGPLEEKPEGPKWKKALIPGGAAVVVLGIVTFIIVRRRRRKQQEEVEFDE